MNLRGAEGIYAHSPDDKASASLQAYIDKIQPELLTEAVGAGTAASIMDAFRGAVNRAGAAEHDRRVLKIAPPPRSRRLPLVGLCAPIA